MNTTAIATNLRKTDGHNQIKQTMQTAQDAGMQTMELSLARLVHGGLITEKEGRFRARDVSEFDRSLSHLRSGGNK